MTRLVLAYSGSTRCAAALHALTTSGCDVVTVTLDLGQADQLDAVRARALGGGASRAHVLDVREMFAREYLLPALAANAASFDGRPSGREIAHALIARQVVDIAGMESATHLAHGATARFGDAARLETAMRSLAPHATVHAPLAEDLAGIDIISYAQANRLPVGPDVQGRQVNVWERVQATDDAAGVERDGFFVRSKPAAACPTEPATLEIEFERGVPRKVNGVGMPVLELVSSLDTIAGAHGIGRGTFDLSLSNGGGHRQPFVFESPVATLLDVAHRKLEARLLPADLLAAQKPIDDLIADVIARGAWFTPVREACDAFLKRSQQGVTGTVRLELFQGTCRVTAYA